MKPIPPFVVKFIEDAEEGGPPKLHVYNDGVGVATIGWGHTGPDVTFGMAPITKAKAEALLALDLQDSAQCVDRLVRVPISEHQRGALISFVFNVGKAGFERSTVLRVLNMGNYAAVPGALRMWNKGKLNSGPTVVIQGLVNRREKEIVLWNTPDAPALQCRSRPPNPLPCRSR